MKKYFVRSLKYFCALCVLCVLIMLLNRLAGTSILTLKETFYVMFHTPKGMLLPVVIVVLAAVYPRIGFVTRRVEGDTEKDRQQFEFRLHLTEALYKGRCHAHTGEDSHAKED